MTGSLTRTVEGMQDALVTDLKGIVTAADKLLNEVACATTEDFAAARSRIAEKLDDAKSRLDDARAAVTKRAKYVAGATDEYVRDNPWQVLGVAAATGVIVGYLLSRR